MRVTVCLCVCVCVGGGGGGVHMWAITPQKLQFPSLSSRRSHHDWSSFSSTKPGFASHTGCRTARAWPSRRTAFSCFLDFPSETSLFTSFPRRWVDVPWSPTSTSRRLAARRRSASPPFTWRAWQAPRIVLSVKPSWRRSFRCSAIVATDCWWVISTSIQANRELNKLRRDIHVFCCILKFLKMRRMKYCNGRHFRAQFSLRFGKIKKSNSLPKFLLSDIHKIYVGVQRINLWQGRLSFKKITWARIAWTITCLLFCALNGVAARNFFFYFSSRFTILRLGFHYSLTCRMATRGFHGISDHETD